MNLLFAHDHRFVRGQDEAIYSQGSFPARVWRRYLNHFAHVRVLARDEGEQSSPDLARSDSAGVSFALVRSMPLLERLGLRKGKLHALLKAEVPQADAVVVRLPSDIGLLAASMARSEGKPLLTEVVGCAFDGYGNQGSWLARMYAPLARWRMQRAVARSDFVLYVTENWLQTRYPSPNARTGFASNVILEPRGPGLSEAREQRLAGLGQGRPPVFGTVASLRTESKGLQTMIAALAELKKAGLSPPEWHVLGPGDRRKWLEMADRFGVSDHVHFEGTLPAGADVLAWLDRIDVHCQPSFQEGLPRGTIEAMSRGCACLGSTAGGLPELLPPERTHRPGDSAGLASLIGRFLRDPAAIERAARADAGRARDYDQDTIDVRRNVLFAQFSQTARERAATRQSL